MYGTEVGILEISKTYEDGRMDIKTLGIRPFRIINFVNPIEGKLYAGGEVEFLEGNVGTDADQDLYDEFTELMRTMLPLLGLRVDPAKEKIDTFTYAHKIGLSLEEEFQLLMMKSETARLQFLIQHVRKALPILLKMEDAKRKIQMNGHFKYLDPLNF